jgi:hypothetical protein
MVEVKMVLAAKRKEEKMTQLYELKMMDEKRWKANAMTNERDVQQKK